MIVAWLKSLVPSAPIAAYRYSWRRVIANALLTVVVGLSCLLLIGTPPALAGLNDDNFDGNIFVLYAGNGSLVPPKLSLAESMKQKRPTLLVFFVDDSKDSKQYASVVSRVQEFYGRAASLIPINVDAIPLKSTYSPQEPGYYYKGFVPQTVVFDQSGKVVLDAKGIIPYEQIDDVFREVFDLLPRTESAGLRRRQINEFSGELSTQK